mgnify:CR=1 FL=1
MDMLFLTIGLVILVSVLVGAARKESGASGRTGGEKKVDCGRPGDEVMFPETEKKIRRLQEKSDRLAREIEEEKERERQYNRLKADLEDMERRMAILQRIIDEEEENRQEDPPSDGLRGINMN